MSTTLTVMTSSGNLRDVVRAVPRILAVGCDTLRAWSIWCRAQQSEVECRALLQRYPRWIQGHLRVAEYLLNRPAGAQGAYFCARCAKELLDAMPKVIQRWLNAYVLQADLLVARSLTAQGHCQIAVQLLETQLRTTRVYSKGMSIRFVEALVAAHVGAGNVSQAQEVVEQYQVLINDQVVLERLRWIVQQSGGEMIL